MSDQSKTEKQSKYIHYLAKVTGSKDHLTYDGEHQEYQHTFVNEKRGIHITTREKGYDFAISKVFNKLFSIFGSNIDENIKEIENDLSDKEYNELKEQVEDETSGGFYNKENK